MSVIRAKATRVLEGIKRISKNTYLYIYGAFFTNPPVPNSPRSFLFICMGNICRSPFAEAAVRRYFPDTEMTARSAGIIVNHSRESPPGTLAAAETFEIDLSEHRSKKIDENLIATSDMVFGMEVWHVRSLRKTFPQYREKIFLLAPFENSPSAVYNLYGTLNIQDPYGKELSVFIRCFERIDACLKGLFSKIQKQQKRQGHTKTVLTKES